MSTRPNINRPRPVTYLDMEQMRFHGNKPLWGDCTEPATYGIDWTTVCTWTVTLACGVAFWVAIYLLALWWA